MRHLPDHIRTIARKATTQLIINSTFGLFTQGQNRMLLRLPILQRNTGSQQITIAIRHWKLRRTQHSTFLPIPLLRPAIQHGSMIRIHSIRIIRRNNNFTQLLHTGCQFGSILITLRRIISEHSGELQQRFAPLLLRKISTTIERTLIRKCNHVQWPATTTRHQLHCIHINLINIGTLLTIHFNTNE